jgi:hypothetical protein
MANEVTTAAGSAGELVPIIVSELIVDAAYAASVARPHCRIDSLQGKPGKVLDIPVWPKLTAAGVAEATDLSNTAINTTKVTVTAAEVGIMVTITDLLEESDVVNGLGDFTRQLAMAVAEKIDTDVTALFSGFSGTVGTTATELTEASGLDAVFKLENANAPRPFVSIMHVRQTHGLRKALAATTGTQHFPGSPAFGGMNYVDMAGYFDTLFGIPIFGSTTPPTINAGVDYAGSMQSDRGAIEFLEKWGVRTEMWRDISLRATEVVVTACYGVIELVDLYGVQVISKVAVP